MAPSASLLAWLQAVHAMTVPKFGQVSALAYMVREKAMKTARSTAVNLVFIVCPFDRKMRYESPEQLVSGIVL